MFYFGKGSFIGNELYPVLVIVISFVLCPHTLCCCTQRVLSRQEELKERARLLLEQARRDAAMKAGNKNIPNSASPAPNRATNACDVSQSFVCVDYSGILTVDIAPFDTVREVSSVVILRRDM